MKESRYVKLAGTILCILRNARILFFFFIGRVITFLQSGNIYHCLLLSDSTRVSYRMFTEWLIEAHYLRTFLKISSRTPHFTTLQKFTDRIAGTILERKNDLFFHCPSSYQCQADILWNRLVWIQVNPCITVLHRNS